MFGFYPNFLYISMRILGKSRLLKLKKKNKGNQKLCTEIDRLIQDLESMNLMEKSISDVRPDADCVHNDGFWFFDINVHRTLILIEFDEEGEATIVWGGTHQEYESIFRNNKSTIEKWLRNKGYIV